MGEIAQKMGFCVFGTHKSCHLCIRGVEVGICIVCHCVCMVLELGHAKVGFCVFGTHKSGHLCMCGVGVGICIVCHCVCVVLGLGYAKVGFCVFGTHKSGHLCMCGVEVTFRLDESTTTTTLPPPVPRSTRPLRRNSTTLAKHNLLLSINIRHPHLPTPRQY